MYARCLIFDPELIWFRSFFVISDFDVIHIIDYLYSSDNFMSMSVRTHKCLIHMAISPIEDAYLKIVNRVLGKAACNLFMKPKLYSMEVLFKSMEPSLQRV